MASTGLDRIIARMEAQLDGSAQFALAPGDDLRLLMESGRAPALPASDGLGRGDGSLSSYVWNQTHDSVFRVGARSPLSTAYRSWPSALHL
jgi:hypothetical protein